MFWDEQEAKKKITYIDLHSPFISSSLLRDQSHKPQTQTQQTKSSCNNHCEEPPTFKLKNHHRKDERHYQRIKKNVGVAVKDNRGRVVEKNRRGTTTTT